MKTAHQIAQRLFEAGVRLQCADENGALLLAPDHLQHDLTNTWLDSIEWDAEIAVSAAAARAVGWQQAALDAAWEDLQQSALADEVDHALWLIQQEDIIEGRAANRSALLREQAA